MSTCWLVGRGQTWARGKEDSTCEDPQEGPGTAPPSMTGWGSESPFPGASQCVPSGHVLMHGDLPLFEFLSINFFSFFSPLSF